MTDLTKALADSNPQLAKALSENRRKRELAVTLRSLRHAANLTQVEVAERAGLDQSHISKLESATGAMPMIETLLKYAAACNAEMSLDFNLAPGASDSDELMLDVSVALPISAQPSKVSDEDAIGKETDDLPQSSTFRVVKGSIAAEPRERVPLVALTEEQVRAANRGEKVEIKAEQVIETVVDGTEFCVSLS